MFCKKKKTLLLPAPLVLHLTPARPRWSCAKLAGSASIKMPLQPSAFSKKSEFEYVLPS
jgi:hypothetical protein